MQFLYVKLYISLGISERNDCVSQILVMITVIMLSCLLSLLPSKIVFGVMMFKEKYPVEIIIWIIVAVVPINSVVYPAIVIVTNYNYKNLINIMSPSNHPHWMSKSVTNITLL